MLEGKLVLLNPNCCLTMLLGYIRVAADIDPEIQFDLCTNTGVLLGLHHQPPNKTAMEFLIPRLSYYIILLDVGIDGVVKSMRPHLASGLPMYKFLKEQIYNQKKALRQSTDAKVPKPSHAKTLRTKLGGERSAKSIKPGKKKRLKDISADKISLDRADVKNMLKFKGKDEKKETEIPASDKIPSSTEKITASTDKLLALSEDLLASTEKQISPTEEEKSPEKIAQGQVEFTAVASYTGKDLLTLRHLGIFDSTEVTLQGLERVSIKSFDSTESATGKLSPLKTESKKPVHKDTEMIMPPGPPQECTIQNLQDIPRSTSKLEDLTPTIHKTEESSEGLASKVPTKIAFDEEIPSSDISDRSEQTPSERTTKITKILPDFPKETVRSDIAGRYRPTTATATSTTTSEIQSTPNISDISKTSLKSEQSSKVKPGDFLIYADGSTSTPRLILTSGTAPPRKDTLRPKSYVIENDEAEKRKKVLFPKASSSSLLRKTSKALPASEPDELAVIFQDDDSIARKYRTHSIENLERRKIMEISTGSQTKLKTLKLGKSKSVAEYTYTPDKMIIHGSGPPDNIWWHTTGELWEPSSKRRPADNINEKEILVLSKQSKSTQTEPRLTGLSIDVKTGSLSHFLYFKDVLDKKPEPEISGCPIPPKYVYRNIPANKR